MCANTELINRKTEREKRRDGARNCARERERDLVGERELRKKGRVSGREIERETE